MDSYTASGPEEVLRLGANYSKAKCGFNASPYDTLKSNGDIGIEVASKYTSKHPGCNPQAFGKSQNYSSEEDSEDDFSSMSLVALAAKHKNNSALSAEVKSVLVPLQINSSLSLRKNNVTASRDSSSSIEGTKHKVEHTFSVDGCTDTKVESQSSSYLGKGSAKNSKDLNLIKTNVDDILGQETLNAGVEEITTKFVAAHFSDDSESSDCDEPGTLQGLALKHAQSFESKLKDSNKECSGSTDNVSSSKPNIKELQNLANYHRQHTKSESDRFTFNAQHLSDNLLKKGIENNVSTSLRSLGAGGNRESEFRFSPAGSIPGSFKSLNASNSLNSSLVSVGMETFSKGPGSCSDMNNAFSDSDINIARNFENNFEKSLVSGTQNRDENLLFYSEKMAETFPVDVVDGGINLTCALKESTNGITSGSLMSQDGTEILDDVEDDQLVTLLDSMNVDEEVLDEEKEKSKKRLLSNSELDESCVIDTTHLLKVKVKIRTRSCSSFGKVVCRQWRFARTPYIRKDKMKTNVIPFDFIEPSPDDVIKFALKRRL